MSGTGMNESGWVAAIVLAGLLQGCISTGGPPPVSDDDAAQANLNLGTAYLRQGRPELALENLERALEYDPRHADTHSTIALAYDQLEEPDQAETHYRRATELAPGNAVAQNLYAVFLCRHDRWEDAERYFARAANNPRYPTPAAALTNAGTCARGAGDTEAAERYFRAALERDPTYADALSSMMELSFRQGEYLAARAFMQRHSNVRPPDARQLWLCFRIERALGDTDAAQACETQLESDFPESSELVQLREFERDGQ